MEYSNILDLFTAQYPSSEIAELIGKVCPHNCYVIVRRPFPNVFGDRFRRIRVEGKCICNEIFVFSNLLVYRCVLFFFMKRSDSLLLYINLPNKTIKERVFR